MTSNQRAELRLRWVLGICTGLILGYIWGHIDAANPPTVTTTEARTDG